MRWLTALVMVGTWWGGPGGWRQTQDQCRPPSGPVQESKMIDI